MERSISLKQTYTLVLTGILLIVASDTFAQATQQSPSPQVTTTTQRHAFGKELKKTVGLLTVGYVQDGRLMKASGTCFFVFYPDERVGKDRGFAYLVTNHHVASPGIEDGHPYPTVGTTLRLNRKDSGGSDEGPIPVGSQLHWYFPTDDAIDLAVLPVSPDQTKYDTEPIPVSMFATRDEVEKNDIAEGDSVVFTGYFYEFPGLRRFQPIVREGVLAMMPDEQLDTTLRKRGNLYLADVHALKGNSGSPLLVNLGGFRNGHIIAGSEYKLLGIVSGFYYEDSELTLTIATTYHGNLEQNSGIAMVVPVDALKDLLDSPPLRAARDAYVASMKAGK
jgi:hypothetical protein